jgi:hypothetical protein
MEDQPIKYIIVKRDQDERTFALQVRTDADMLAHVRATVENTGHTIISIINVSLFPRTKH